MLPSERMLRKKSRNASRCCHRDSHSGIRCRLSKALVIAVLVCVVSCDATEEEKSLGSSRSASPALTDFPTTGNMKWVDAGSTHPLGGSTAQRELPEADTRRSGARELPDGEPREGTDDNTGRRVLIEWCSETKETTVIQDQFFAPIRHNYDVLAEDIFNAEWTTARKSAGSDSLLQFSADKRFVRKSLSKGRGWFSKGDLRTILDDAFLNALANHMRNPKKNTLLARILMLLEENGNYYVVMNNWFPDGGAIFDLKGSYNNRYKRKFSNETLVPTESEWKDLDFITFIEKYPVVLQHTPKVQGVFRAIYDDLLFLNKWNVVDYSLLIQVKLAGTTPVVPCFDQYDAKAMSAQVMYGTIGDEVYEFHFGGFIDFLSTYRDWGKKARRLSNLV